MVVAGKDRKNQTVSPGSGDDEEEQSSGKMGRQVGDNAEQRAGRAAVSRISQGDAECENGKPGHYWILQGKINMGWLL